MPISNNNYSFTNIVYEIPQDAIVSGIHPTAVITIVPNYGYSVTASNFSIAPGFSDPSVLSIVFTQSGTNVLCTVTFVTSFVMPSSNYTINLCMLGDARVNLITIDGTINAVVSSNVNGDGNETSVPYSNSGAYQEIESLFTRTYNADSGYYLSSPSANIVVGNQSNYTITQTPTYDLEGNLTNISYNVNYIYPLQDVTGDVISFKVAAREIFTQIIEITAINCNVTTVSHFGATKALEVFGVQGAVYSITATDGTTVVDIATNVTMGASGYQQQLFEIPSHIGTTSKLWTCTYTGDIGSSVSPNPLIITQLGKTGVILQPLPSSAFTGGSVVLKQYSSSSAPAKGTSSYEASIQWIITSTSGNPLNIINPVDGIAWGGNASVERQVINTSGTSMTLDDTTGIVKDMRFGFDGVLDYTVVSVDSATSLTVSPAFSSSMSGSVIFTDNNGFNVDTSGLTAAYSNAEQSSVLISGNVIIERYGDTDTTMQLDLSNLLSVNVSGMRITSDSYSSDTAACAVVPGSSPVVYFTDDSFGVDKYAYTDAGLTTKFVGDGDWYSIITESSVLISTRISATGYTGPIATVCSSQP